MFCNQTLDIWMSYLKIHKHSRIAANFSKRWQGSSIPTIYSFDLAISITEISLAINYLLCCDSRRQQLRVDEKLFLTSQIKLLNDHHKHCLEQQRYKKNLFEIHSSRSTSIHISLMYVCSLLCCGKPTRLRRGVACFYLLFYAPFIRSTILY